jgi:hypothetical protein
MKTEVKQVLLIGVGVILGLVVQPYLATLVNPLISFSKLSF